MSKSLKDLIHPKIKFGRRIFKGKFDIAIDLCNAMGQMSDGR